MSSVMGLRSHISEATDGASWICDTGYTLDPQLSNLPITKHLFFFLKILFIHLRERERVHELGEGRGRRTSRLRSEWGA